MKERIRDHRFTPYRAALIERVVEIIAEYDQKLTARQVFYQLVSRDVIPNTPREYQKTTALLTDARYAGLIDWDAIEDRGRVPQSRSEFADLGELTDAALSSYRLPRWADQDNYVELWVEKQALAGVLWPIAARHHVTLMVNKGYSSASAMKESADRITERSSNNDKPTTVIYLGDHDPSGEDMVRDINARLVEFGAYNLAVEKVALTMAQIKKWKPPPNPAKLTDSRARAYIAEHGSKSWELDALSPKELNKIVETAILGLVDGAKYEAVKAQEERDKKRLRAAMARLK